MAMCLVLNLDSEGMELFGSTGNGILKPSIYFQVSLPVLCNEFLKGFILRSLITFSGRLCTCEEEECPL